MSSSLSQWQNLAVFTKKGGGNEGTHDLKLHQDKLRGQACLHPRIQKPIEGHVSFLLDVPEEAQITGYI